MSEDIAFRFKQIFDKVEPGQEVSTGFSEMSLRSSLKNLLAVEDVQNQLVAEGAAEWVNKEGEYGYTERALIRI